VQDRVFRVWRPSSDLIPEGTSVWIGVDPAHLRAVTDDASAIEVVDAAADGG